MANYISFNFLNFVDEFRNKNWLRGMYAVISRYENIIFENFEIDGVILNFLSKDYYTDYLKEYDEKNEDQDENLRFFHKKMYKFCNFKFHDHLNYIYLRNEIPKEETETDGVTENIENPSPVPLKTFEKQSYIRPKSAFSNESTETNLTRKITFDKKSEEFWKKILTSDLRDESAIDFSLFDESNMISLKNIKEQSSTHQPKNPKLCHNDRIYREYSKPKKLTQSHCLIIFNRIFTFFFF